ncbi:MAG: hypothetical protein ABIL16_04395 [candidate division WOR-3 bacterium]
MEIKISLNGKYPRSEGLVKITRDYDRGRVDYDTLMEGYRRDYEDLLKLQEGLDMVSDGLLIWDDIIRPISQFVEGAEVGGLIRYFETNTFVRKITFKGKDFVFEPDKFLHYFRFGNLAILPGPYTLWVFSEGLGIEDLGEILGKLVSKLVKANYEYIYLQEPALPFYGDREHFKPFERAIKTIRENSYGAKVIVNTYFSPINKVLGFLLSLDVDGIGLDFTFNDIEDIKRVWKLDKGMVAGIVDTTNSLIETPGDVREVVDEILSLDLPFVIFTGSSDFEFLPREIADKKFDFLKRLKEVLK